MDRRIASLLVSVAVGVLACGSGGGGGGAGSADPVAQCQEFLALTSDCYAQAGKTVNTNPQACNDPSLLDERTRGQVECALASRDAYCRSIVAAFTRDASAVSPTDPEVVRLNACTASKSTVSPCREAVLAVADCGGAMYFPPACTGPSAALANCVLENPRGACAIYSPREAGATFPPEAQSFQQCQIEASKVPEPDAGTPDAF